MRTDGRVASTIAVLLCAAEFAFVALFAVYSLLIADANHTGLPLGWVRGVALATGLASILSLALRQRGLVPRRLAAGLLVSSVVMLVTIDGFERLNLMMEYGTWVRKGMPKP